MSTQKDDFERLTRGLVSKSDKIRALARHGVPTADIARYLDIRYQHARNVLIDSGLHRRRDKRAAGVRLAAPVPAAGVSPGTIWLEVDDRGHLPLTEAMMSAAGIRPGDVVAVSVHGDALEVRSKEAALRRAQEIMQRFVPSGARVVDEFIAERHREAMREDTQTDGSRRADA
jgi:hypothetical protein